MLIDSHCHLEYKGLVEDQQGVLARARAAGISGFLNISTRQREWDQVIATAEREPDVWASVGIHPHEADAHADLGEAALITGKPRNATVVAQDDAMLYELKKDDFLAALNASDPSPRIVGSPDTVLSR